MPQLGTLMVHELGINLVRTTPDPADMPDWEVG